MVVNTLVNTVQHTDQDTLLIEQVIQGITAPDRSSDEDDTGVSIAAGGTREVVGLALDGSPALGVRNTCPVQSGTSLGVLPMTVDLDEVLELVGTAVDGLDTVNCLVVHGREVVEAVDLDVVGPAGLELTGDQVVHVTVAVGDEAALGLLTAVAVELVALNGIGVAGSGVHNTPVEDGLADRALGAAVEAVLGTGSGQIVHSDLGVAVPDTDGLLQVGDAGIQLGLDILADVTEAGDIVGIVDGEGLHVGDLTVLDLVADGGLRSAALIVPLVGGVMACGAVPCPCVDGDGDQGSSTGNSDVTHAGDGQLGGAGQLVQLVGDLKAMENVHVLQSPFGSGVKPDLGGDGLDGLHLIGVDHQVVLRAGIQLAVSLGLGGSTGHGDDGLLGLGGDGDLLGQLGVVALLIRDLEGHVMDTVGQDHAGGGDLTCGVGGIDLLAVHVDLGGSGIQTGEVGTVGGIIGHGSGEVQSIKVDGRTELVVVQVVQYQRIADDGSVAIVHHVGVVQSDVIDVDGALLSAGGGGGDDELDEGGSIVGLRSAGVVPVLILVVGAGHVGGGDRIQIAVDVCPTCLGDLLGGQLGEALLHVLIGEVQVSGVQLTGSRLVGIGQTGAETHGLLGDVHPHTQTGTVDALLHVAVGHDVTQVVQVCVLPVGMGDGLGVVQGVAQRVVTAVNRVTVLAGRQEDILADTALDQVTAGSTLRLIDHGITAIVQAVLLGLDHVEVVAPLGDIGILEVLQDVGALTEGNVDLDSTQIGVLVGGGHGSILDGLVGGSAVDVAQHLTGRHGEVQSACGQMNLCAVVHSGDREVGGSAVGNSLVSGGESDGGRIDDVDVDGTNHSAVIEHLHGGSTQLAVGGEDAVFDGTEGIVGQGPGHVSRDLSGAACQVRAQSLDGDLGGRSVVSVLGAEVRMVKGTVSDGGGDDHQGVGDRADGTVAANVADDDLVSTLQLSGVGSGSATVQLDGCHAAQGEHDLSLLILSQTCGVRLVVTVGQHQHDVTVCLHAHGGAGILVHVVGTGDDLTVPDQHGITTNSLLDLIGILAEGTLLTDHGGAILQDSEEGVVVARAVTIDVDTFHNEAAGGLTGGNVVVGSVGRSDDVVAALRLGGIGLLNDSGLAPVTGVVIVVVVSLDLNGIGGRDVGIDHEILDTVALLIVGNDRSLGHAGGQGRLGRRGVGQAIRHGEVCGLQGRVRRECNHRHHTRDHQGRQSECENASESGFSHVGVLL